MTDYSRQVSPSPATGEIAQVSQINTEFDYLYNTVLNKGIGTAQLTNLGVTTEKIAANAITSAKLSASALTLPDGSTLTTSALPTANSAKIANTAYVDAAIAGVATSTGFWKHSGADSGFGTAVAPTTYTDRDISAITGTNRALVLLKVTRDSTSGEVTYWFRTSVDDGNIGGAATDYAGGTTVARIDPSYSAFILVETSATGIFQWKASSAKTTTITVVGYVE